MPTPLSMDLCCRIVRAVEGGSSIYETGSAALAEVGSHRLSALIGHKTELVRIAETTRLFWWTFTLGTLGPAMPALGQAPVASSQR